MDPLAVLAYGAEQALPLTGIGTELELGCHTASSGGY